MDIVIDASIIVAVITDEPAKQQLVNLTRGADLLAPSSVHWEVGNAFSAMLKRDRIKVEQAVQALEAYHQISIRFVDVGLDESLRIADQLDIYAYDAYLLRCAAQYRSPLLSLDRGLIHAAKQMNIKVVEVNQ